MISLPVLFAERHDHPSIVATHHGREVSWKEFDRSVFSLAKVLDGQPQPRWGLICENTFEFAVGFFALWQAGKEILLPPHGKPGTLEELVERDPDNLGLISDVSRDVSRVPCFSPLGHEVREGSVVSLDPNQMQVSLYTSGSTGERKEIRKTFANLEDELRVLEQLWGAHLQGARVFGTVSHQHIYGLLFRLLWPLSCERVFHDTSLVFPEDFMSMIRQNSRFALISTPTHLRTLPEMMDLEKMRFGCAMIFSSGAPLSQETACKIGSHLGFSPVEVLGSTETGGIGWRQQTETAISKRWHPLPRVTVKASPPDFLLEVHSPFVSIPKNQGWFLTGDAVEIGTDGTFYLLGRKDRLLKVEGKRTSLTEMENRLTSHPFVQEAVVTNLPPVKGAFRLGAVVVLSAEGSRALRLHGKMRLNETLKNALQPFFEDVAIPRKWRYVAQLPRDTQDKVSFVAIQSLFESPPGSQGPRILSQTCAQNHARLEMMIPHDLIYVRGHFPQFPIVPGFVQIHWAMKMAIETFQVSNPVDRMEAIKFHHPLQPGTELFMELTYSPAEHKVTFSLANDENRFASGRIYFVPNRVVTAC